MYLILFIVSVLVNIFQSSHSAILPIERVLPKGISNGTSLNGTSLKELKPFGYNVAAAGEVENYSEFPLIFEDEEAAAGVITTKLDNVAGGYREAFASRKTGDTAKGTWVRYSLSVENIMLLHIMYSAPYNFNFHKNWLAAALCFMHNLKCASMDATKMYYGNFNFVSREDSDKPVKTCSFALCVIGTIGGTHRPDIHFKVYPKSFENLHFTVQIALKIAKIGPLEYFDFMKGLFPTFM